MVSDYKLEKTLSYISFLFRKYLKEAKKNLASNEKKRKNHHEKNPQTNGPIIYQRNCLTFGSLRCSNKEPGLKIFFHDIIKINIRGS